MHVLSIVVWKMGERERERESEREHRYLIILTEQFTFIKHLNDWQLAVLHIFWLKSNFWQDSFLFIGFLVSASGTSSLTSHRFVLAEAGFTRDESATFFRTDFGA